MKKMILLVMTLFLFLSVGCRNDIEMREGSITTLKVMSKNVLFTSLNDPAVVFGIARNLQEADIIGCQEINAITAHKVARMIRYAYVYQQGLRSIFSKYPIIDVAKNREGVQIQLPDGRTVWLFNLHLPPENYGPYQVNSIGGIFSGAKFFDPNDPEMIAALEEDQRKLRIDGPEGKRFKKSLDKIDLENESVFVTGDFNEPSHLDWTQEAVTAGNFPAVVQWPASKRMAEWGFNDSFRQVYPDPVANPGFTWTCDPDQQKNKNNKGEEITEPFDRIDFIYNNGVGYTPANVTLFGPEGDNRSNIYLETFSSDHRTTMIEFTIN